MNYEAKGIISEIFPTQVISDKFSKREFVLEVKDGEYTELIKFQLTQDRCDLIDNFTEGQEVTVHFNLKGKKWEKDNKISYFTNLEAWRIESVGVEGKVDEVPQEEDESSDLQF